MSNKRYSTIYHKTCSICSSLFVSKSNKTKYCGPKCVSKAGNMKNYKPFNLTCKCCGKGFISSRNNKFCSKECRSNEFIVERECKKCGKLFMSKGVTAYCSNNCSPWRKSDKPLKIKCLSCDTIVIHPKKKCEKCKEKVKKSYTKTCPTCSVEFQTATKTKVYCKAGHSPGSKELNKLRKRTERNCKLSVESWNVIDDFKKSRPIEFQLDHIVPLNHPDVCGLHNTWNFQWLSKEDNRFKSNKFDGSVENCSWKKNLKK